MKLRHALLASVCTAFLAASAATSGAAAASNPAAALMEQGYQHLAAGQTAEAIAAYSVAIDSHTLGADVLASALLNRGLAYQNSKQHQKAIDDYTAALGINALGATLRATALYNRGLAYQQVKRPALAIEDFTAALLIDTAFAHAYYSRGNALRDSGQLLFALSDYERAIRSRHPQPQLVHYSEALAFEALRRPAAAQASLLKALAVQPDYQPARIKLEELGLPIPPQPKAAEPVITGSTTKPANGAVIAKTYMPAAVTPPSDLVATAAPKPRRKLYHDRVPTEPQLTAPSQEQAAAAPPEPAAPAAEDTVAVAEPPQEAPAPSEEAAPAAAEPPLTGWSVQLSSQKNETVAWNVWNKMKARHAMLAGQQPVVVRADLGTRGIFYRLRLAGFEDQSSAKSLCAKLKSRRIPCFVSKLDG